MNAIRNMLWAAAGSLMTITIASVPVVNLSRQLTDSRMAIEASRTEIRLLREANDHIIGLNQQITRQLTTQNDYLWRVLVPAETQVIHSAIPSPYEDEDL